MVLGVCFFRFSDEWLLEDDAPELSSSLDDIARISSAVSVFFALI